MTVPPSVEPASVEPASVEPGAIVVGVDGSDSGERALRWAADQAALQHLPLTRVQVAQDPGRTLVDLSKDASVIVVGSRGRGPVMSLLLGSVSLEVARQAHCPVVVVRPHTPHVARPGIAVGIDLTRNSLPTLEFAFAHASLRGIPLTVLHSVLGRTGEQQAEDRERLREFVDETAKDHPDVEVHLVVAEGLPEEQLVRLSHEMQLVVVGRHHTSLMDEVGPGSAYVSVAEHADCTVAVVPGGDQAT
jgi:nucleotide-binding universal stress UspA family protein